MHLCGNITYQYREILLNLWCPAHEYCLKVYFSSKPIAELWKYEPRKAYLGCRVDRLCCQISWLQIQRSGFYFRRYQIFWGVVGLERSPLSLVSIIEELLGRKSSGSGLENKNYGRRGSAALTTRHPLYPQKLALTWPTGGRRSVGIVRSRTQATEFSFSLEYYYSLVWNTV
jgi:hypothetical protein